MQSLIELVEQFRRAANCDERERLVEEMVKLAAPLLRAWVARKCPPPVVEDVCQEVWAAIGNGLSRFRGETEAAFWAWCRIIVRRKCADSLRREPPSVPLPPEQIAWLIDLPAQREPELEFEGVTGPQELLEVVRNCGECFTLLWWLYIDGWSLGEVARELDITKDAVRMRRKRCLDELRRRLNR